MKNDWRFFLWIVWDHQEDKDPFRFFRDQYDARKWIEDEHARLWDSKNNRFLTEPEPDPPKRPSGLVLELSRGFEVAMLLEILPSGEAHQIDAYSTVAGEDGNAQGWDSGTKRHDE